MFIEQLTHAELCEGVETQCSAALYSTNTHWLVVPQQCAMSCLFAFERVVYLFGIALLYQDHRELPFIIQKLLGRGLFSKASPSSLASQ